MQRRPALATTLLKPHLPFYTGFWEKQALIFGRCGGEENIMHYLPFYTGDYIRHTRHLSIIEHGAYFLLLTYCWDMEGPVPLDERQIFDICKARTKREKAAVIRVLNEFFVKTEEGWYNPRVLEELEKVKAKYHQTVEAGKASALKRSILNQKRDQKRVQIASEDRSSADPKNGTILHKNAGLPGTVVEVSLERPLERPFQQPESVPVLNTSIDLERESSELDLRSKSNSTSLSENKNLDKPNGKAKGPIPLQPDWKFPERWIQIGLSVRPDLSLEEVKTAARKFRVHYSLYGVKSPDGSVEWYKWIEDEDPRRNNGHRYTTQKAQKKLEDKRLDAIDREVFLRNSGGAHHG